MLNLTFSWRVMLKVWTWKPYKVLNLFHLCQSFGNSKSTLRVSLPYIHFFIINFLGLKGTVENIPDLVMESAHTGYSTHVWKCHAVEGEERNGQGKGGEERKSKEDLHSASVKMLIFTRFPGSGSLKIMIYCGAPTGLAKCQRTAKLYSYLINLSLPHAVPFHQLPCCIDSHLESNQRRSSVC